MHTLPHPYHTDKYIDGRQNFPCFLWVTWLQWLHKDWMLSKVLVFADADEVHGEGHVLGNIHMDYHGFTLGEFCIFWRAGRN